MSVEQATLTGDTTDVEREKPSTWVYCGECDVWMLRSKRHSHEHETHEDPEAYAESLVEEGPGNLPDDGQEEIDEPEEVGSWYDITISYSVDYRFRIPAPDESSARSVATDRMIDATPSSKDRVHTRVTEGKTITEDCGKLPEDWEPGMKPLWEVLD